MVKDSCWAPKRRPTARVADRRALRDGGLTDLLSKHVPGERRYSYVLDGEAGHDHALATPTLAAKVAGATIWHINADGHASYYAPALGLRGQTLRPALQGIIRGASVEQFGRCGAASDGSTLDELDLEAGLGYLRRYLGHACCVGVTRHSRRCNVRSTAYCPGGAGDRDGMVRQVKKMPLPGCEAPPRRQTLSNGGRVAIGEVARRAGVSIATVSRVLNGVTNKTSAATIARVEAAIEELGYRPSRAGSALRSGRSRLIALVIPDTTNAYNGAVAASVETAMREGGHVMIVCNTGEDPDLQDDYLLEMRSHLVRGLVLFGAVPSPVLERFVQEGEPVVFVNRRSPVGIEAPFVGIDNYGAGREVAEHFLLRGYQPIGILHGPLYSSATADRFRGFRDSLAESGILVAEEHVRGLDTSDLSECYQVASELLAVRPRPRAIFCTNDIRAYGAYRRCLELGLSVPDDVALFGYDDNPLNQYVAPWLNSVHVPYALVGAAVRSCFEQIWDAGSSQPPPQIILPYELVLRDDGQPRRGSQ